MCVARDAPSRKPRLKWVLARDGPRVAFFDNSHPDANSIGNVPQFASGIRWKDLYARRKVNTLFLPIPRAKRKDDNRVAFRLLCISDNPARNGAIFIKKIPIAPDGKDVHIGILR